MHATGATFMFTEHYYTIMINLLLFLLLLHFTNLCVTLIYFSLTNIFIIGDTSYLRIFKFLVHRLTLNYYN